MLRLSTGLRSAMMYDGGIISMFNRGRIYVYGNTPPLTADEPPGASPLAIISEEGVTPTPGGAVAGGLQFFFAGDAYITHYGNWVLKGLGTGSPVWWRLQWYPPDDDSFSFYYPRMDGTVGESLFQIPDAVIPDTEVQNCEFHLHFTQAAGG